jgi:hypothetical protein
VTSGYPTTERAARAWIRKHWQDLMRNADVPDLPADDSGDLIASLWSDEGRRLANRLEPRRVALTHQPEENR